MSKRHCKNYGIIIIPGYKIEGDKKSGCLGCHSTMMREKECESSKSENKSEQSDAPDDRRVNEHDPVNHPSHYTFGKHEVIDILEDWFSDDPLLWQVGKYISRAGHKGNMLEDLKKAAWYLNRRIEKEERSVSELGSPTDGSQNIDKVSVDVSASISGSK